MTASPLLSLEDIVFSYPDAQPALRGISLSVCRSERIAVLGNNGAGKSTFFLVCNGILRPQQGTVRLDGQPVSYDKKGLTALRRRVGIVFQDSDNQILASTVESEVSFGPMNLRLPLDEVKTRVEDALCRMGLENYRRRTPQYLSGGEKKRVGIADILAMQPEVILFDEPTASLDPKNTAQLADTLDQLSASGIALVISTHDIDFAYRFADRVVIFHDGRILADGDPDTVFSNHALLQTAGLRPPILLETVQLLRQAYPQAALESIPRTPEAFVQMISGCSLLSGACVQTEDAAFPSPDNA